LLAALVLAAALAGVACGEAEPQPAATPAASPAATPGATPTAAATAPRPDTGLPGNLFANPGFEEGEGPWFSMTTEAWGPPFRVSDAAAHSGRQSALLAMRGAPEAAGAKVFGVVQEVAPAELPELVSGYYRVQDWVRGTEKQYLQFVVIVIGPTGLPGNYPNYQIRYPLAGIDEPPFPIANAHFLFIGTEEPVTDQWVYFETNIREDFQELWGALPQSFEKIRVLFEVRYDGKVAGSGEVKADVFYDDLYLGPAEANPNRPAP
jgi:hypothetical protein